MNISYFFVLCFILYLVLYNRMQCEHYCDCGCRITTAQVYANPEHSSGLSWVL